MDTVPQDAFATLGLAEEGGKEETAFSGLDEKAIAAEVRLIRDSERRLPHRLRNTTSNVQFLYINNSDTLYLYD